jgi:hypothetical protein
MMESDGPDRDLAFDDGTCPVTIPGRTGVLRNLCSEQARPEIPDAVSAACDLTGEGQRFVIV